MTPSNSTRPGSEITPWTEPAQRVQMYQDHYAKLLPSHIDAGQWVRLAQGALRRNQDLAIAALNSPESLIEALSDAARQGLEPGTDEYYLVPRKEKGVPEVQGITGYMGYIELMYRAGAVSSVIAEVVYTNDVFQYRPGREERPIHEIDWDADDRGEIRFSYAYAIMLNGSTSKVVVINKKQIERIKASSSGSSSKYSPWVNDPAAMWLKSAVRQLRKWVPTSSEWRREQVRAVQDVQAEQASPAAKATITQTQPLPPVSQQKRVHPGTGEVMNEAYDAEPETEDGWPEVAQPGGEQRD